MKKNSFCKIALSALAACLMVASCNSEKDASLPVNKKEIMDAFKAGTLSPHYVPAAFFVHFDRDHKSGEPAVNAHLQYLLKTNADILKVQFEQSVPRIAGLDRQETWNSIKPLPEDYYRPTVEIIRRIQECAGRDIYVMPTVYSAYQVARQSLRDENIAKAAVERPEDLKRVLGYYLKSLEWFVRECKKVGIEGFYMTTQGGEMKYNSIPGFFDEIIKPLDLQLMQLCQQDAKLTILHICDWEGTYDRLDKYTDYPGDIVNTPLHLNGTPFTLTDGEKLFGRPVLGGLKKEEVIIKGSTAEVAEAVKEILANAPAGRVMIGADCTVSAAPIENIHTAVMTAHKNPASAGK